MASDLVNRLRGPCAIGIYSEFGTRDFSNFIPPISLEAATEIERLNARVKELEDQIQSLYEEAAGEGL